jgi:prepilin-type processing-associated H-X9-DG protein/prepilin-type N-terminal cleavage/methylation domain-containing protein
MRRKFPVSAAGRPAFTLIEMLVVIGIIGILVGMLMPAIQSARESARRTQCVNNIKQIGVALAGFEATAGRYPAGVASPVWGSYNIATGAIDERASWGFFKWTYFLHLILPRLQEQTYYDALRGPLFRVPNVSSLITNDDNLRSYWASVDRVPLPSLLCASDGQAGAVWIPMDPEWGGGLIGLAKSNYLGFFSGTNVAESLAFREKPQCEGYKPHPAPPCAPAAVLVFKEWPLNPLPPPVSWFYNSENSSVQRPTNRRAVFGYGQGTTLTQVKDGSAHTIAVAEYLRGVSDRDGRGAFWENLAGMQSLQATTTPNSKSPDVLVRLSLGESLKVASQDWGCTDEMNKDKVATPNDRPGLNLPCKGGAFNSVQENGIDTFAGARSRHPGGVNVLFVDGHVSFINDSIDGSIEAPYGTWQRLVWIDDGNEVGEW